MSLRNICLTLIYGCCVASCATRDPVSLSPATREVASYDAFALLPDRSVVSVLEERVSNGTIQTIYLDTNSARSGDNYLKVTLYGPVQQTGAIEDSLSYVPLTDGRIMRELRSEMPGITMTRTPYYVQNNYGPFSYATGTNAKNEDCIYAWQQIRAPSYSRTIFNNRGRIDIRLRLCETNGNIEKLLANMYNFSLNAAIPTEGWNPYGEPEGPSTALGRPGNPLYAPKIKSNLNGPFSSEQLNTERLNDAFWKSEDEPEQPKYRAPTARRPSAQRVQTQEETVPAAAYPDVPAAAPSAIVVTPSGVSTGPATSQPATAQPIPDISTIVPTPQQAGSASKTIVIPAPTSSAPDGSPAASDEKKARIKNIGAP